MTNAEKYALKLQRDYGIEPTVVTLDDETFNTVDKVAFEVLSAEKYQQWRKDYDSEVNKQVITFIDSTGLKATLKAIARRNGRSLGAEIRRILEAEIARRELKGEPKNEQL